MTGEQALRNLEQKVRDADLTGSSITQKERDLLIRAKDIEKRGQIFSDERPNPIYQAAYQRFLLRSSLETPEGDEELAGSENGDSPESTYGSREGRESDGGQESSTEEEENLEELAERATEEELMAEELSIEQEASAINNQIVTVHQEGKSFGKPSKLKYFILFGLAIIVDAIDWFGLTGIGLVLTTIVAVICTVIMYLIFWFTNTKQKNAQAYQKKIGSFLDELQRNVAHLERRAYQVARFAGKRINKITRRYKHIKAVKAFRKGTAGALKAVRTIRRSPGSKFLAAAAVNLIPIVSFLPWQIIGVWLSYKDERETYRDAAKASDELLEEAPAEV